MVDTDSYIANDAAISIVVCVSIRRQEFRTSILLCCCAKNYYYPLVGYIGELSFGRAWRVIRRVIFDDGCFLSGGSVPNHKKCRWVLPFNGSNYRRTCHLVDIDNDSKFILVALYAMDIGASD